MLSAIIAVVLLVLFAFVDVWYFIRAIKLFLEQFIASRARPGRISTIEDVVRVSRVNGIVLPSDLDLMLHMNNSKYLRELDFGRFKLLSEVMPSPKPKGTRFAMSAITIRYRRAMLLWQHFIIESKVLCWKDDAVYFEQRFVGSNNGFIFAVAIVKFVIRGARDNRMQTFMETAVGCEINSPPIPPDVQSWMDCIAKSSESLKKAL